MTGRRGKPPVVLGRITTAYGLKGWVRTASYTEPRDNILRYRELLIRRAGRWEAIVVEEGRVQGRSVLLSLVGVADRDAAQALAGSELAVDRSRLPATAPDEYYWVDLIGLNVSTVDGRELGRVDRLMDAKSQTVLVVAGERERLIPIIPGRTVRQVDLEQGRITVDWDADF